MLSYALIFARYMGGGATDFGLQLIGLAILISSIVVHEVAHGAMANRLGDPTARLEGRLSLNPLVHLDLVGSVILPLFLFLTQSPVLFGWAKPVPYNPYNLKHPRRDEVLVALAGPFSNIALALVAALAFRFSLMLSFGEMAFNELFLITIITNIFLAVFNLIPVPPLDGSKVFFNALPSRFQAIRHHLEQYSFLIIFGLFLFPPTRDALSAVVHQISLLIISGLLWGV